MRLPLTMPSPQERLVGERVVVKEIEIFGNFWYPRVGEDIGGPDGWRSVSRPWHIKLLSIDMAQCGKAKRTVIKILVLFVRWNRSAFLFFPSRDLFQPLPISTEPYGGFER